MKSFALITLCALVFSTSAYIHSPGAYDNSLQQKNLKLQNHSYTAYKPQDPSGLLTIATTITVKNGKVVKREFKYDDQTNMVAYDDDETGEVYWDHRSWIEDTPEELGSHEEGFATITLDDVYDQCAKNILTQDPRFYGVSFGPKNDGLISWCTYFPGNESDGAPRGIVIGNINY